MSKWPDNFLYGKNDEPPSGSELVAVRPIFGATGETFDGRQRVVTPTVVDDVTFVYDLSPFRVENSGTVGGYVTHVPSGSIARLVVEDTGSFAGLRGQKRIHYVVGQTIEWGSVVSVTGSSAWYQWGLFDDKQGFFFEKSGSDIAVVKRSSVSGERQEQKILRNDWNVDPIDGTGASGHSASFDDYNIYSMTYQCHGTGRTMFFINERLAHVFDTRGADFLSIIGSGDIVPSFEVRGPGSGSMDVLGSSIKIDGESPDLVWHGRPWAAMLFSASIGTNETHILSVRPKTEHNGVEVGSLIYPTDIEVMALDPILIQVYMGLDGVSGGDWQPVDSRSVVEKFTTGSFDGSNSRTFIRSLGGSEETIHLHEDMKRIFRISRESLVVRPYNGGQEILTVTARKATGGGNTTVSAVIRWDEVV